MHWVPRIFPQQPAVASRVLARYANDVQIAAHAFLPDLCHLWVSIATMYRNWPPINSLVVSKSLDHF